MKIITLLFDLLKIAVAGIMAYFSFQQLYEYYFSPTVFTDVVVVNGSGVAPAYLSESGYLIANAVFGLVFLAMLIGVFVTLVLRQKKLREITDTGLLLAYLLHRIIFNGTLF